LGSGAATHVINKNEKGEPAFILRPPNLDTDPKARLWRVQMADLRISGNEKSGNGIFAEGFRKFISKACRLTTTAGMESS
jgi:hypothetical protein